MERNPKLKEKRIEGLSKHTHFVDSKVFCEKADELYDFATSRGLTAIEIIILLKVVEERLWEDARQMVRSKSIIKNNPAIG
jgi:hypothetical protein